MLKLAKEMMDRLLMPFKRWREDAAASAMRKSAEISEAEKIAQTLKAHHLFKNLTSSQLNEFCKITSIRKLDEQEVLLDKNSFLNAFFIIIEGELEVLKKIDEDAELVSVTKLRAGDVVGGTVLLEQFQQNAVFRTTKPTEIIVFDLSQVTEKFKNSLSYKSLIHNLAFDLAKRLRAADVLILSSIKARLNEMKKKNAAGIFAIGVIVISSTYVIISNIAEIVARNYLNNTTIVSLGITSFYAIYAYFCLKRSGYNFAEYGITVKWNFRVVRDAILLSLFPMFVILLYKFIYTYFYPQPLFNMSATFKNIEHVPVGLYINYLIIYIISCPVQEFLMRGFLQGTLHKFLGKATAWRRWEAIIFSNVMFASGHVHISLQIVLAAFLLGLFWGWMFSNQRSLLGVSISHIIVGVWGIFIVGFSSI